MKAKTTILKDCFIHSNLKESGVGVMGRQDGCSAGGVAGGLRSPLIRDTPHDGLIPTGGFFGNFTGRPQDTSVLGVIERESNMEAP